MKNKLTIEVDTTELDDAVKNFKALINATCIMADSFAKLSEAVKNIEWDLDEENNNG